MHDVHAHTNTRINTKLITVICIDAPRYYTIIYKLYEFII